VAGKVPVGGVGSNSCPSCCFAEHHCIGTALARQCGARFQESSP
jgi:hypothetical protein